jgi:hypothetical protein
MQPCEPMRCCWPGIARWALMQPLRPNRSIGCCARMCGLVLRSSRPRRRNRVRRQHTPSQRLGSGLMRPHSRQCTRLGKMAPHPFVLHPSLLHPFLRPRPRHSEPRFDRPSFQQQPCRLRHANSRPARPMMQRWPPKQQPKPPVHSRIWQLSWQLSMVAL